MLKITVLISIIALMIPFGAQAQILLAFDDEFAIPRGLSLEVEAFGVLENDILDGENAGETGATAELVSDVSFGTLDLLSDGSFTYSTGPGFDGLDSFTYRAVFGAASAEAMVVLTACEGGPDIFDCWHENAYLSKGAKLGYVQIHEGFEDDVIWGAARSPYSQNSVVSQGIRWEANANYDPPFNNITTGPGPARTGQYGFFDPEHGYATGTVIECDVDEPAEHCLYKDGWTGYVEGGAPFHGAAAYITASNIAKVAYSLDGGPRFGGGFVTNGEHQFFGVIDTRLTGFYSFSFIETDGKVGQAQYIFGDDFVMLAEPASPVAENITTPTRVSFAGASPNPSSGSTLLRFTLHQDSQIQLDIFDARGHLVRRLTRGPRSDGQHAVGWDGRDRAGRSVAAGTYFGRLVLDGDEAAAVVRKIVIAR